MEIFIRLFIEFFKTGLFAVGGGLASIPFLKDMINKFHWFSMQNLADMIAVSQSTPGPIGVNMATYVGFITGLKDYGIAGALIGAVTTTIGLVFPSVVIICIIAHFLKKFKENQSVQSIFYGLRPAVTALIASAGLSIVVVTLFNYDLYKSTSNVIDLFNIPHIILFIIVFISTLKIKKLTPIMTIVLCALIGILLKL